VDRHIPPWILPTPVRDDAGREWSAASGSLPHGITTELVGNSENPRLYSMRRRSVKQSKGTLAEMKDGNSMNRMMLLLASLPGAVYTRG